MATRPPQVQRTLAPVIVPSKPRENVIRVAAGSRHAVALNRGGEVLTWGIGSQGQLGRIAPFDQSSPEHDAVRRLKVL